MSVKPEGHVEKYLVYLPNNTNFTCTNVYELVSDASVDLQSLQMDVFSADTVDRGSNSAPI